MPELAINIEHMPVGLLTGNPKNPRKHDNKQVRQIANSIKEFGFTSPILSDADNRIIAGHGRLLAAQQIGMEKVPVIRLEHLSESQAKALMIADNKLTENSEWDEELLSEHFLELSKLDLSFDLDITGFEIGEIDLMIGDISGNLSEEEDDIPELNNKAVSKSGDLWHLGNHKLYCGNSLSSDSYDVLLSGQRADMIFTDPPYNVPVNGHVSGLGKYKHREFAMASGEMTEEQFTEFLKSVFDNFASHSTDGSLHYICMDWRHMSEILISGNQEYSELKNLCVWVKDNGGMGSMYRSRHELVFVFKHGKSSHCNNVELGKYGRYRTNVWKYAGANSFARNSEEEDNPLSLHPTVKPVQMIADAILDCTGRNNIVLDGFLGSGSTLIAAEKTGRRCYGIEIDSLYVDVSIRRWQQLTREDAIHADSGITFNEMEAGHE